MDKRTSDAVSPSEADVPAWGAVVSMMLGVFGLVGAEFLPASLLTPMAADLDITEAVAGQAVSITAVLAFAAGLLVATVTRKIDRRNVLLGQSVLLIVSSLLVAFAPSFAWLLLGRALLGVAVGSFWAMSTAIVMRLVPDHLVPRGLAIMTSGVAAATIFAAPAGSYLGAVIGWRNVFVLAAALGVLVLAVQFFTLPRMAPRGQTSLRTLFEVLKRPGMALGLVSIALVFSGHFALFTYVRPYLEQVTGLAITGVSAVLLGFGIANYVGTYLGGLMMERYGRLTLAIMPLAMGVAGLILGGMQVSSTLATVLVAIWGLAFGTVPVAWSTWVSRTVPDEAESGGGLLVAVIQVAIAVGASAGGMVLHATGIGSVFDSGGLVLVAAALIITFGLRPRRALPARA